MRGNFMIDMTETITKEWPEPMEDPWPEPGTLERIQFDRELHDRYYDIAVPPGELWVHLD
jgi:hypothetical protein